MVPVLPHSSHLAIDGRQRRSLVATYDAASLPSQKPTGSLQLNKPTLLTGQLAADDTEIDTAEAAETSLPIHSSVIPSTDSPSIPMVPGLFDPSNDAYNSLAVGETQTINVNYKVTDAGGLTDTSSFSITVNGNNDNPTENHSPQSHPD